MNLKDDSLSPISSGTLSLENSESDVIQSTSITTFKYNLRRKTNLQADKSNSKYGVESSDLKILSNLIYIYKRDWKRITPKFKNLTKKEVPKEALRKIAKELDHSENRRKWYSKEEDDLIVELVNEIGFDWKTISNNIPGREPLSIRDRYYNLLKLTKEKEKKETNQLALTSLINEIRFDFLPPFLGVIYEMQNEITQP